MPARSGSSSSRSRTANASDGKPSRATKLAAALEAKRESKHVAFRPQFVARQADAWPELIKDVVALANSGGGVVVIGVARDGRPAGGDAANLQGIDRAALTQQIAHFTGERFEDLEIVTAEKDGAPVLTIAVGARGGSPLVFEKPGASNGGVAFAPGTVYFRHGGRSRPATAKDIARFAQHEVTLLRRELARNVRRASTAPPGSDIIVAARKGGPPSTVDPVRIVDDLNAPAVARTDFDVTHPYRQTELIDRINERAGRHIIGPFEMLCVRRAHLIDDRPEFFHRPKFGSPQYSDAFATWVLDEFERDPEFFHKAKDVYRGR